MKIDRGFLKKAKQYMKGKKSEIKSMGRILTDGDRIRQTNALVMSQYLAILRGLKKNGIEKIKQVNWRGYISDVIVDEEIEEIRKGIKTGKYISLDDPDMVVFCERFGLNKA
jgi:hypothetical protein